MGIVMVIYANIDIATHFSKWLTASLDCEWASLSTLYIDALHGRPIRMPSWSMGVNQPGIGQWGLIAFLLPFTKLDIIPSYQIVIDFMGFLLPAIFAPGKHYERFFIIYDSRLDSRYIEKINVNSITFNEILATIKFRNNKGVEK